MNNHLDPRITELETLAREEGITLPMPPAKIVELENRGYVVDLTTGVVLGAITAEPTPSGSAVCYLLADVVGEVAF